MIEKEADIHGIHREGNELPKSYENCKDVVMQL